MLKVKLSYFLEIHKNLFSQLINYAYALWISTSYWHLLASEVALQSHNTHAQCYFNKVNEELY